MVKQCSYLCPKYTESQKTYQPSYELDIKISKLPAFMTPFFVPLVPSTDGHRFLQPYGFAREIQLSVPYIYLNQVMQF